MEKVITTSCRWASLALICTACGNVESLRVDDISGLQNRSSTWVYGLVTSDRTGAPIGGVTVLMGGQSNVTKDDGTYRIDGLAAIETTGTASVHGFQQASLFFKLEAGANLRDFALEPNECGRNDCRPDEFCSGNQCVKGAVLSGIVLGACTDGPLGARVTIDGKSLCSDGGKTGYFRLEDLTPGGPHVIAVGKAGYRPFTGQIILNVGLNAMDTVRLTPEGGCGAIPAPAACQP